MKFLHPSDTKAFLLGVVASITAVVVWDFMKFNKKLLEHKPKENE